MFRYTVKLLSLCSVAAFSAGTACRHAGAAIAMPACRGAPIAMQERRFEVCQGRYCTKKGAKRTLALFEELAAGAPGALVEIADMGHTDHGCFDECPMGRESGQFRTAVSCVDVLSSPRFCLPQRMCASAAMGLAQTAGRSSTASMARPRWRSCLGSALQPRHDRCGPLPHRAPGALEGAASQTPNWRDFPSRSVSAIAPSPYPHPPS